MQAPLLAAIQFCLAAVLLYAGAAKLLTLDDFRTTLSSSRLADTVVWPVSVVVPVAEIGGAGAIVTTVGQGLQIALLAVAALLCVFTCWLALVLARRLSLTCACFGV